MPTNYPTAIDNGTTLPDPSATNDTNSPSLSSGQGNQNGALIAIETLLGTNATQTEPIANSVLLGTGTGTNEWGSLTSAYTSGSTGTGNFVLASSPTLSSPTINSPTISNPTFTGSLGGITASTATLSGLLTANGGITATGSFTATGLVNYADLLSTIFSGQLQSYTNTGTAGGTFYYINLGGLKLLYGQAVNMIGALSPTAYEVNFPSGFFNAISAVTTGIGPNNTTNQQTVTIAGGGLSTSNVRLNLWASTTTTAENVHIIVIGS